MIEKEVQELLSFIDGNPTAYHTTASVRNILLKEGFSELPTRIPPASASRKTPRSIWAGSTPS